MNWYKYSQRQSLLFYPWNARFEDVKQEVGPVRINEKGEKIYECGLCGKEVHEDDIEHWTEPEEAKFDYKYPIHNLDIDTAKQQIQQCIDILSPYIEKYNADKIKFEAKKQEILNSEGFCSTTAIRENRYPYWDKQNYKVDIPQLFSITSDQNFQQYIQLLLASLNNYSPRRWDIKTVGTILFYFKGSLNGDQLEKLESVVKNPRYLFLDKSLEEISNFSVQISVPVCEECMKDIPKCYICNKPIFKEQLRWPVCGNDSQVVCNECVENGDVSICIECGCADSSDDMNYIEDEGEYCDSCYSKLVKDYSEYFYYKVESLAAKNPRPFKSWFNGKDRIYLPFTPDLVLGADDSSLMKFIGDIEINDERCDVNKAEYQLGYCTCGERRFRIGKVLGRWYKNEMKRIDEEMKGYENEEAKSDLKDKYDYYKNILDNSKFRSMKDTSNLKIVISQDPHDIARMSTGRRWTSCMNLERGNRSSDVFCEVEEGGLIAYLVDSNDLDIERPHARILIRRFVNKEGDSIAFPEESVYGNNVPGFEETVENWLKFRQGKITPGTYRRKGMDYSETFSRERVIAQLRALLVKMALKDVNYQMIKTGKVK